MSARVAAVGALLVLLPVAFVTVRAERQDAGRSSTALAAAIPRTLGPWQGDDGALDAGTLRILRTDDYLHRSFRAAGRPPVTLTVVFSLRERKTVHPPEVCFAGQGWEIENSAQRRLAGDALDMATLTVSRPDERLLCAYWYVAGGDETPSYVRQQWNVALSTLGGSPSGSALVRLTVPLDGGAPRESAEEALEDVASRVLPALRSALR